MNILIIGTREEGKTTLALFKGLERHDAVVAFDPRGMIDGYVVRSPDELEEAIKDHKWIVDGEGWQGNGKTKRLQPIVYRCDGPDLESAFEDFCSVIFPPNFPRGGYSVIIDEAGWLQTANSINDQLFRAIKGHPTQPPEEEITIIQTMHTLSESNGKTRSLINEYYLFRLKAPGDTKAVQELTGIEDLPEILKSLSQHHFVRYINSRVPAGQSEWEIVSDSESWNIGAVSMGAKMPLDNLEESGSTNSEESWAELDG
jgi:hypothetical protein